MEKRDAITVFFCLPWQMQIRRTKTTRRFHETNHTVNYCCLTSEWASKQSDCHTYTYSTQPNVRHMMCLIHGILHKIKHQTKIVKRNLNTYVSTLCVLRCSQNWNGMQNMAYINWLYKSVYHISHIRHATVRCVPTCTQMCAQIITNMELLPFYSLNHKNVCCRSKLVSLLLSSFHFGLFAMCGHSSGIFYLFTFSWWFGWENSFATDSKTNEPTNQPTDKKNVTWQL